MGFLPLRNTDKNGCILYEHLMLSANKVDSLTSSPEFQQIQIHISVFVREIFNSMLKISSMFFIFIRTGRSVLFLLHSSQTTQVTTENLRLRALLITYQTLPKVIIKMQDIGMLPLNSLDYIIRLTFANTFSILIYFLGYKNMQRMIFKYEE